MGFASSGPEDISLLYMRHKSVRGPAHLKYCGDSGEINLLSAIPAVLFSEVNARQDNTDVPQGPPIVASRPITRFKAKPHPRGE